MTDKSNSRAHEFFAKAKGDAAGISSSELEAELNTRSLKNVFPFEVFHPKAKEFMTIIHKHFDIPRSFIGLNMLTVYSSAIGTAYAIKRSSGLMYMSMWSCMVGMTSSGKTLPFSLIFKPLREIQNAFDLEWKDAERQSHDKDSGINMDTQQMKAALFRDIHISTLVRTLLPENPKGVTKEADEILEWINGLNAMARKEGTDEQFWLSAWNGSPYSGVRSGRVKFSMMRLFVNAIGGVQPSVAWKLFKNDRDTTGFIFRILFATAEEARIALPENDYHLPPEIEQHHARCIQRLYNGLPVYNETDQPKLLTMSRSANKLQEAWRKKRASSINAMTDSRLREIHAGILGKISEYAARFSGLLVVSDSSYDNRPFEAELEITEDHMARALKLADYFYESAWEVYSQVTKEIVAPVEVLRFAGYIRANWPQQRIGDVEFPKLKTGEARRKKAGRTLKGYVANYPKVFNAEAKG